MTRSGRLGIVKQATAHNEREHAERVAAAERHVVEMEEKLGALEQYRREYEAGFAHRASGGQSANATPETPGSAPRRAMAAPAHRPAAESRTGTCRRAASAFRRCQLPRLLCSLAPIAAQPMERRRFPAN